MIKEGYNEIAETFKNLLEMKNRTTLFDEAQKVDIDFVDYIKKATQKVKLQSKDWNFEHPLDSGNSIRDANDRLFDFTRLRSIDNLSEIWIVQEVLETFPFMLEPTGANAVLSEEILSQILDKKLHFEFQSLCIWSRKEVEVWKNGESNEY
ncbi:hypothetical protein [Lactococcus lactis]|uniref:hypothetical protein n=1 Tax=Lactococcus TaxID=1357 RepID=UPI0025A1F6B6|nr:hypothetical protein [Lactococcus lactis]MDM7659330.1 hypothetical protein [Lactococcus lactis]MDQ7172529.1 hypothetical protein [Lactococcus lactis]WMM05811.1 hypothetical protein RCG32_08760 [Lactococcus lactis]WMM20398.1 hypothetical protein RCG38_02510 [Lactococcus lactis]WMM21696.1 hypothetical protein RCG51_08770 [Lactococcus lactis]